MKKKYYVSPHTSNFKNVYLIHVVLKPSQEEHIIYNIICRKFWYACQCSWYFFRQREIDTAKNRVVSAGCHVDQICCCCRMEVEAQLKKQWLSQRSFHTQKQCHT